MIVLLWYLHVLFAESRHLSYLTFTFVTAKHCFNHSPSRINFFKSLSLSLPYILLLHNFGAGRAYLHAQASRHYFTALYCLKCVAELVDELCWTAWWIVPNWANFARDRILYTALGVDHAAVKMDVDFIPHFSLAMECSLILKRTGKHFALSSCDNFCVAQIRAFPMTP